MTGFVGHMKNCIKQNRSQLNSQNTKFRENVDVGTVERKEMQFKEVSQKELELIKEEIRLKANQETKQILFIGALIALFFGIACWYFFS